MLRDPGKVLEEMLKVVPKDETELRPRLEVLLRKALYKAPEVWQDIFTEGAQILFDTFGPEYPEGAWEGKVADIWTERKVERDHEG